MNLVIATLYAVYEISAAHDRECAPGGHPREHRVEGEAMVERVQFLSKWRADDELLDLLRQAKGREVSEDELHEQRVSFAYGNAMSFDKITKETVRRTSRNIKLRA